MGVPGVSFAGPWRGTEITMWPKERVRWIRKTRPRRLDRHIQVARQTRFAVKQHGVAANDHICNAGFIERRPNVRKQPVKPVVR